MMFELEVRSRVHAVSMNSECPVSAEGDGVEWLNGDCRGIVGSSNGAEASNGRMASNSRIVESSDSMASNGGIVEWRRIVESSSCTMASNG